MPSHLTCHHARLVALGMAAGGVIATATVLTLEFLWLRDIDLM